MNSTEEKKLTSNSEKLSVIIPAYNEGSRIVNSLKETQKILNNLRKDYEIIVVNDGSKDDTFDKALRVNLEKIKVLNHDQNYGKGNAIKYGFNFVKGDLVFFLDADLDLHPRQIFTLLEYMKNYDADVVIGSKRHSLSKLDYPRHRRFLSWGYHLLVKFLFGLGIKDSQTGLKLFKYKVLRDVFPKVLVKKFAFDVELLVNAHHLGYKIIECPIELNFQGKLGNIKLRDIYNLLVDTLAVFYRLKVLKYYDRINH